MEMYNKCGKADQDLKWAHIWYQELAYFHHRGGKRDWHFSVEDVITFLRSKRDAAVPGWKRMKIIDGLVQYRTQVQQRSAADLKPLQEKMVEIIQIERARDCGYATTEEAVGKINPKESDAVQAFRRALRKNGNPLTTERSYVGS